MCDNYNDCILFDVHDDDLVSLIGSIDLSIGDSSLDGLILDGFIDYNDTLIESLTDSPIYEVTDNESTDSNNNNNGLIKYNNNNFIDNNNTSVIFTNKKKNKRKLIEDKQSIIETCKQPKLLIIKKEFYQLPFDLINAFNAGDLVNISKSFHHLMHSRCLFQINEYEDLTKLKTFDGPSSVVLFFNKLMKMYPDGYLQLVKIKTKYINNFQVIKCKLSFNGTLILDEKSKTEDYDLCPIDQLKIIKDNIKNNDFISNYRIINGRMDLYIDEDSNRIVLSDIRYQKAN